MPTHPPIRPLLHPSGIRRNPRENIDRDDLPADWSFYSCLMREHDEAMVRDWKEEVDTLLVFAGLFSAIVTAFDMEVYKLLQPDPSQPTILVLETISQQLQRLNGNSTSPSVPSPRLAAQPSMQAVRINALCFSSLVCALLSALIGIMVKQWLREYMAAVSLSSRDSVRLRQHRFEGLITWHIPEIMQLLPILLETSLILFLAGLVDFLFFLQSVVAAIVTSLVAASLLVYAITTVTPAFSKRCPFKSPQAWVVIRTCTRVIKWVRRLRLVNGTRRSSHASEQLKNRLTRKSNFTNWGERDSSAVQTRQLQDELDLKAMTWIHTTYLDHYDVLDRLTTVIPELSAETASKLVFRIIARKLHISSTALISQVRARSCSDVLRDAGADFDEETRSRTAHMLLRLLQCLPRDHDSSTIGPVDVLWSLWEFTLGASTAEKGVRSLIRSVLTGVASLVDRDEPFRLRRAAINLLHEGTLLGWSYSSHPTAIGSLVSFAKECYQHNIPDLFMKTCVVVLLPHGSSRKEGETTSYHRQQLQELLRDLTRFLQRGNEEGMRQEPHNASKLVSGLDALVEKDADLVEAALPEVLLEGVQLGLLELSREENHLLREMLKTCSLHRTGIAQRARVQPQGHLANGAAQPA